ncbi:hypothetical protein [Hydrogenimonas sp.]
MVTKIENLFNVVKQPKLFKKLLSMGYSGYLKEIGWIDSFLHQRPMDAYGKPLPWVTYSFIDFISERLNKEMDLFEFGSGNSTLWYARRVNRVVSLEHDYRWFVEYKERVPDNVSLFYRELEEGGAYAKFLETMDHLFDIVVVDGRERVECIRHTVGSLKEGGVIVLDDSERESYREGIDYLTRQGFKRVDFWGISPGLFYKKCTTIFYRKENCLEI